jgi:uncharacterized protein (TIGR03000 family)
MAGVHGVPMTFVRSCGLALLLAGAFPAVHSARQARAPQAGQTAQAARPPAVANVRSRITITMPAANAQLLVDGRQVEGLGAQRTVDSPRRAAGTSATLTIVARWKPNGYTEITRTREVPFTAGEPAAVDLSGDDPTDRVKIIYVPTPQDAAEEMARLANVGPRDVVYEPGCGDARITIAALRRGARRGICIDIDKARVNESRNNVRKAGLASTIEVYSCFLDVPKVIQNIH